MNYTGEIAALLTALFWTVTSMSYESAGKKVGSVAVNLIRLVLAFFFYAIVNYFRRDLFLPTDAGGEAWMWLALSGVVGFVLGDLFLFKAFVMIGARVSMLIMALAPPVAALVSWMMLGERLSLMHAAGMAVTLTGICLVILKREKTGAGFSLKGRITAGYNLRGVLFALGGAVGQGAGLVLSKKGMGSYDAMAASHIRVMTGFAGFLLLVFVTGRARAVWKAFGHGAAMRRITLGSVFGPFLGVTFSLAAVQHTGAGIAATLMSVTPVLILAPSALIFHERINRKEILGALITVAGVALFFL